MGSFDDDEEADMNSNCAAVSQILLSLEDALSNSPRNRPPSPPHAVVHCENVFGNYELQSTVDDATLTLGDNRLVSIRLATAANDSERQGSESTQIIENDDCDETQYVEQCCEGGLGLVSPRGLDHTETQYVEQCCEGGLGLGLVSPRGLDHSETQYVEQCCGGGLGLVSPRGLDHAYASMDHTDNSIALSVDNSPSLLDATKLFPFISSDNIIVQASSTTADVVDTTADTQMHDVDVELQGQTRQDIGQPDTCSTDVETVSVPTVGSITDSHLLTSNDDHQFQLRGCGAANGVTDRSDVTERSAAVSSHSASHGEYVGTSDDGRPSPLAVVSHMEHTSSLSCASLQVDVTCLPVSLALIRTINFVS